MTARHDISAVKLSRDSKFTYVWVESHGQWIQIIKEPICGQYHHICETSGLDRLIDEHCEEMPYRDLAASGGIANAP